MSRMECLYYVALSENDRHIYLNYEEAKHSKALRLKPGNEVLITNGKGLTARCSVAGDVKAPFYNTEEFYSDYNELPVRYSAVIGIIENKDRMEFCVEKLTELGIAEIRLTYFERSAKIKADMERLERKTIAALKQCKRSVLPRILLCHSLEESLADIECGRLIVGDAGDGVHLTADMISTAIVVGPEGGITKAEEAMLEERHAVKLKIGVSRLRTETAAVALMAKLI